LKMFFIKHSSCWYMKKQVFPHIWKSCVFPIS